MSSKKTKKTVKRASFNLWILNGDPPTIALGEEPPKDELEWLECEILVNENGSTVTKTQLDELWERGEELEKENDALKSALKKEQDARELLIEKHEAAMFRLYAVAGLMGDEGLPETWPELIERQLRLDSIAKHSHQEQEKRHKQEVDMLLKKMETLKDDLHSRIADIHGLNDLVKDYERDIAHWKAEAVKEREEGTEEIARLRNMLVRLVGPMPKLS